MKKQIRKLIHRFENLKFRKKLSVLMLIAGLVPVVFLAFSMQYGMTNQLREKEQYNLEKILEQSVNSIENQSQIYENLVDYLSYSQSLRNIFDTEMESDYEKYLKYVKVADPLLQMPTIYHKEIRSITLYSDNIEVPHGDTLLPMSEAENQQWYSRLNEGTLMQWSITRGGNKSIIASRKFYDNDTIKAVLEMRLDYEKVLEPFMSQLTDNTGGMIQDDNGNVTENKDPVLVKKTISKETSDIIKDYMLGVVEEGTGASAAVEGYAVGGKTGTAAFGNAGSTLNESRCGRSTKNSTCAGSNSICHQRALDARKFSVFVEHVCLGRYTDQSSDQKS